MQHLFLDLVANNSSSFAFTEALSANFFTRFAINAATVWLLIRGIYFSVYKTRDLFFTFFIFNLVIFLISYALNGAELSMGAAFGLFAVFSMLRYRTEDISIKDMTYLFLSIAIGVLSAVATGGWQLQIAISTILLVTTYFLESTWLYKKEVSKVIYYEQIALVAKDREAELIEDLKTKTGLPIHRVQVQKLDFVRDSAELRIFYYAT